MNQNPLKKLETLGQSIWVDQIFIKNLVTRGIIGVNDWEREKPQEISINIVIFTDAHKVGESDAIQDSVNYRTVEKKVLAHAETTQRQTIKALAADLARLCLDEPGAVRFSSFVGVEIERTKGEMA